MRKYHYFLYSFEEGRICDLDNSVSYCFEKYKLADIPADYKRQIRDMQGKLAYHYLVYTKNDPDTYLVFAVANGIVLHVSWVVSASVDKKHRLYPEYDFFIGPCYTMYEARGKGIYPQVLKYIMRSSETGQKYAIAVEKNNIPSIKGIERAGAEKKSNYLKLKYLGGMIKKFVKSGEDDE